MKRILLSMTMVSLLFASVCSAQTFDLTKQSAAAAAITAANSKSSDSSAKAQAADTKRDACLDEGHFNDWYAVSSTFADTWDDAEDYMSYGMDAEEGGSGPSTDPNCYYGGTNWLCDATAMKSVADTEYTEHQAGDHWNGEGWECHGGTVQGCCDYVNGSDGLAVGTTCEGWVGADYCADNAYREYSSAGWYYNTALTKYTWCLSDLQANTPPE